MSDISGGNDKKIKQKTIAQAILGVMGETKRSMTSKELLMQFFMIINK